MSVWSCHVPAQVKFQSTPTENHVTHPTGYLLYFHFEFHNYISFYLQYLPNNEISVSHSQAYNNYHDHKSIPTSWNQSTTLHPTSLWSSNWSLLQSVHLHKTLKPVALHTSLVVTHIPSMPWWLLCMCQLLIAWVQINFWDFTFRWFSVTISVLWWLHVGTTTVVIETC